MANMNMCTVSFILIIMLFARMHGKPLDSICDSAGKCMWNGGGWYRGCIDDIPILYFDRFDGDGLLDLRDCSVQVVAIEITPLRCKDLNQHVVTDSGVTFYLGEAKTECHVSPSTEVPHQTTLQSIDNSEHASDTFPPTTTGSARNSKHPSTSPAIASHAITFESTQIREHVSSSSSEILHPTTLQSISSSESENGNDFTNGRTFTIIISKYLG
ncbi:uncharacterized protein LOC128171891 [Crassostrea angulata]|uniref:uncharacterized protein LOC128171891 n=1 Tax=Magallana angulata TaxID=2784310 RepID=UPI00148A6D79|nr:uncharacterized protein LOC117685520 [Crassostrea gigas]XP_052693625.1 uncharacterized protein LOC128171891 [Crassostrea angulata]